MKQSSENDSQEVERKIIDDPVRFMIFATNFKPYWYQKDFLECESKRIVIRSGRQIGKSTVVAARALYQAFTYKNQQILILAPTQRQATLLFWKIREFINSNPYLKEKIVRETLSMMFFDNGSDIHTLPAGHTGDTIRGFSPSLIIIDEAAFVPDEVFTAIEPALAATDGNMIMLSTPFGKRGRFYNAFQEEQYIKFHIKSEECPLITPEFLEEKNREMAEVSFKQEFEGEFMEEADTFFTQSLILSCIEDIDFKEKEPEKEYYLGVDIARYGSDETVFIISEIDANLNIRIVDMKATSKKPITDTVGRIVDMNEFWNFRKVYVDESSVGGGAVDLLREKGIAVKAITFTLQNKNEMYDNLKLQMEKKKLKFPKHDRLIQQLLDLQVEYTSILKLKKIHHPNSPHAHDDYPDALVLAVYVARRKPAKFKIYAGKKR